MKLKDLEDIAVLMVLRGNRRAITDEQLNIEPLFCAFLSRHFDQFERDDVMYLWVYLG